MNIEVKSDDISRLSGTACGHDPGLAQPANQPYALRGPQVEPASAFWLLGARLPQVVPLENVLGRFTESGDPTRPVRPEFFFPTDDPTIQAELAELVQKARTRFKAFQPDVLSHFIDLQNPPFGAVFDTTKTQYRVNDVGAQQNRINLPRVLVNTGGQLARMFEEETPGLLHRHALNWLLYNRSDISPPRQARIWMALDVTIYSALSAAWYFKWAGGPNVQFRLRPYEFDRAQHFAVLFDKVVPSDGNDSYYQGSGESVQGAARFCPCPSPGTPRHPAYPSGHSTYSSAASRILEYFFSQETLEFEAESKVDPNDAGSLTREAAKMNPDALDPDAHYIGHHLRKLARNIGEARLWAGVHWRSDHVFGQMVGMAVADEVIAQLRADCIPAVDPRPCEERPMEPPPSAADLANLKQDRLNEACPYPDTHDTIPPVGGDPVARLERQTSGVN